MSSSVQFHMNLFLVEPERCLMQLRTYGIPFSERNVTLGGICRSFPLKYGLPKSALWVITDDMSTVVEIQTVVQRREYSEVGATRRYISIRPGSGKSPDAWGTKEFRQAPQRLQNRNMADRRDGRCRIAYFLDHQPVKQRICPQVREEVEQGCAADYLMARGVRLQFSPR
jgi:hypothetical protein